VTTRTERVETDDGPAVFERTQLVRLCARLTGDAGAADDLTQEALAEAWRLRDRLSDPVGRWPWLSAIARNLCLRWLRSRGRIAAGLVSLPEDALAELALAPVVDPAARLTLAELRDLLGRAMARLPPSTRRILLERYAAERPVVDIASDLGVSQAAVTMRLRRGEAALRRELTGRLREEAWGYIVEFTGGRPMAETDPKSCSFCGRPHAEVRRMIAGPNRVYICDACVAVCNELIAKEEGHHAPSGE
jgi:RNA polymerase sigma factor (sigma-70 family)